MLNSERAQKIIKDDFVSRVEIYGKDRSDEVLTYIKDWKTVGVEIGKYLNLPEVHKFLTDRAINIKIKIWGKDNSDKFIEYVESWRKAGVDLSKVAQSPKAKRFLDDTAISIKIEIWGKNDPSMFVKFATEWKKAGVDLFSLLNTRQVQQFLEDQVKYKLKYNKDKVKNFVTAWVQAGWQPSPETQSIVDKL